MGRFELPARTPFEYRHPGECHRDEHISSTLPSPPPLLGYIACVATPMWWDRGPGASNRPAFKYPIDQRLGLNTTSSMMVDIPMDSSRFSTKLPPLPRSGNVPGNHASTINEPAAGPVIRDCHCIKQQPGEWDLRKEKGEKRKSAFRAQRFCIQSPPSFAINRPGCDLPSILYLHSLPFYPKMPHPGRSLSEKYLGDDEPSDESGP